MIQTQENDISWQVLRRIVRDWAGAAAELDEVKPLVGGCINTTLALRTRDGTRAVLKISPHRVNREYTREAYQLNMLREMGLPAPEVYASNVASLDYPHSYLLMQFVEGVNLKQAKAACSPEQYDRLQMHLAELVLSLHERTATHYQRIADEHSGQFISWPEFYRHIYDPIWFEVDKSKALSPKCRKQIQKIHEKLPVLLAHEDRPRLVHWDIWSTNLLVAPDSRGRWWVAALLDPNCKYAHAEAEIAYMELFNTSNAAFLRAYQQTYRLGADYQCVRKFVYQMYPLLNHVRLFGAEYVKPLEGAVAKVAGTM